MSPRVPRRADRCPPPAHVWPPHVSPPTRRPPKPALPVRAPPACALETPNRLRAVVEKLHVDAQILVAQELDDRLQLVSVAAEYPDLRLLNLCLHLALGPLDELDDLPRLFDGDALLQLDPLPNAPAPADSTAPRLSALSGTWRFTSFVSRMSSTCFSLNSSSAEQTSACSSRLTSAGLPLKSKRCPISRVVWWTALSTSCRSTLEAMSKEHSSCSSRSPTRVRAVTVCPVSPR